MRKVPMNNPYFLDGPAVISFSGGATSGFMLHQVWLAHGKKIPSHVKVAFANTGLEHPKTLDFVERCSLEWDVEVNWLEYDGEKKFKLVNYSNASRNGEPFELLIKERLYYPNPVARFCTVELKIRTIDRWSASLDNFAFDGHIELLGLRYDEPRRVAKIKNNNRRNEAYCPMYDARHTLDHVDSFWTQQPFKLEIPRLLGNCVGCFLKSAAKINLIARDYPGMLEWWATTEENGLADAKKPRFRSDRPSYRAMINMARDQSMFDFPDDESLPCNCTD